MTVDSLPEPGSSITAYCCDKFIEGQVLCIDVPKKIIVIQKPSQSNKADVCDILILRAELLRELKITKVDSPPICSELSLHKISERIKLNERNREEKLKFYGHDVPTEARELAECLGNIFTVVWNKPNIVVMEHTIIIPPYREDNVSCTSNHQQAHKETDYIRKVVYRYYHNRTLEDQP